VRFRCAEEARAASRDAVDVLRSLLAVAQDLAASTEALGAAPCPELGKVRRAIDQLAIEHRAAAEGVLLALEAGDRALDALDDVTRHVRVEGAGASARPASPPALRHPSPLRSPRS
jgi:hypothetical protein